MSLVLIMTPAQAEWEIYKTANEQGKLAIPVGAALPEAVQLEFEKMLVNDLARLIDVSPMLVPGPGGAPTPALCRIFLLTEAGKRRREVVKMLTGAADAAGST